VVRIPKGTSAHGRSGAPLTRNPGDAPWLACPLNGHRRHGQKEPHHLHPNRFLSIDNSIAHLTTAIASRSLRGNSSSFPFVSSNPRQTLLVPIMPGICGGNPDNGESSRTSAGARALLRHARQATKRPWLRPCADWKAPRAPDRRRHTTKRRGPRPGKTLAGFADPQESEHRKPRRHGRQLRKASHPLFVRCQRSRCRV
jgi:hypothetical protein